MNYTKEIEDIFLQMLLLSGVKTPGASTKQKMANTIQRLEDIKQQIPEDTEQQKKEKSDLMKEVESLITVLKDVYLE